MSDKDDWINEFIPAEQVEQIEAQANKIIRDEETFYEMTILMSQGDMITAVRAMDEMRLGNTEAWMMGLSILSMLIETMAQALERDDIDAWEDE